jgi:hypothetical protein
MFFSLSTALLVVVVIVIIGGSVALGVFAGHRLKTKPDRSHESIGVVQGALLGLVGLLLAFGLSMAVSRYEARRAVVVQEANDIGTTYLRAQLLAEPARTQSLDLLRLYGDAAVELADQVPNTSKFRQTSARLESLQNDLWKVAGDAVREDPVGTAPKVYIESLNDMIDIHTDRVASVGNRVPGPVMMLQIAGSAIALGVLALYLVLLGRGITTSIVAAVVVILILLVSFDLDRPQRGFITVPYTALVQVRASMDDPPAATGP